MLMASAMSAMRVASVLFALLMSIAWLPQPAAAQGPLNPAKLLEPPTDTWPTYHGDYTGRHFSPLKQVDASNVKNLSLAWFYRMTTSTEGAIVGGAEPAARAGAPAGAATPVIKAMPLMVNGILYLSMPNRVYAVDARTGRQIWQYLWRGRNAIGNRGVAMSGGSLFVVTPDNTVLSLDAATGRERWSRTLTGADVSNWSSSAPLVIRNRVLVGIGGDTPVGPTRAFVEALDIETGASQWKWWVTPGPGEPGIETWPNPETSLRSAGAPWQPFTYDPELNLVYVTTGQPTPTYNGKSREGANLYTCSVVALNADNGKMAWHYQFSPHETHDWDAAEVAILVDDVVEGKPRKLLAQANRNGYFFTLDRVTGAPVVVKQFAWSNGYLRIEKGRLIPDPAKEGSPGGTLVFPTSDGAVNFPAQSFSPNTGLFYTNATDAGSIFYLSPDPSDPTGLGRGQEWHGGYFASRLVALDYRTGIAKWEHKYAQQGWGSSQQPGVLSTGGGLVFSGDPSGNLIAFDATIGKILWHAPLGAQLTNSPQTYSLDGRQYVVVAAADTLWAFYLQ
jgi:alcohol dehydrogenase (cytochrome c)